LQHKDLEHFMRVADSPFDAQVIRRKKMLTRTLVALFVSMALTPFLPETAQAGGFLPSTAHGLVGGCVHQCVNTHKVDLKECGTPLKTGPQVFAACVREQANDLKECVFECRPSPASP